MKTRRFVISFAILLSITFAATAVSAKTKPGEYNAIVYHLKTKYQAKKVNMFVMWAARALVSMAKPAGVKSFSLTVFQHLKFSNETVDAEMQAAMRKSYGPEWTPVFHVRSRTGQQAYLYLREDHQDVKVVLVTIDTENAAVIRATFSPDKLIEFLNDPQIMGIKLNDNKEEKKPDAAEPKVDPAPFDKPDH
jgi:hypothetical protein